VKRRQIPCNLRHLCLTDPRFEEGHMRGPVALPGIVWTGKGLWRSVMRHVEGMVAASHAWTIGAVAALVLGAGLLRPGLAQSTARSHQIPSFQVDPTWPKRLPTNWELGSLSGIDVDADDHVWVIQRPPSKPDAGMIPAPPVLEYDAAGKLIESWGGPGPNYEWPGSEHGIYIDYKGFVWVSGSGTDLAAGNDQILKFTKAGKFVMQIGHKGKSTGNTDKENMNGPADMAFIRRQTKSLLPMGISIGASSCSTLTPVLSSGCGVHSAMCRPTHRLRKRRRAVCASIQIPRMMWERAHSSSTTCTELRCRTMGWFMWPTRAIEGSRFSRLTGSMSARSL
jgi:hypothetical protein